MKQILIVDDEATARRILGRTLTRAGFEVREANNGRQAWEELQSHLPDAVITDIDMPQMSGEELCKHIARHLPERKFPIFIVTSKTAVEHREWSAQLRDVIFIEKPFSLRQMIDRLNNVLGSHNDLEDVV